MSKVQRPEKSVGKPAFLTLRLSARLRYNLIESFPTHIATLKSKAAQGLEGGISTPAGLPRQGPRLAPLFSVLTLDLGLWTLDLG
jgi:hypothetical protein